MKLNHGILILPTLLILALRGRIVVAVPGLARVRVPSTRPTAMVTVIATPTPSVGSLWRVERKRILR